MALGATARMILLMVIGQGIWMIAAGVALGIGGAVAFRNVMSTMVYGVATIDPATYAIASAVLAGGALLACAIPARRAATLDPVAALRVSTFD
jgi:ABC-type antimicrobial peptide transport system permease subunit